MRNNFSLRKSTKKVFQALSVMAVLFSPAAALANPPGDGWALVFSDNFNGTTLDTNKWNTCYWWGTKKGCNNGGAKEVQWFQPDDVTVSNGFLHLRAQKRSMNGYDYTSGMISSHDKYAFQYGYAEMRAKVPKGNGFWPTFWLGSQNKVWPPEIDIAEFVGSDMRYVHLTLHYADASSGSAKNSGGWWGGKDVDFSADYHTYAVQWSPEAIVWYVDGVERRRYTTTENIPAQPMYIMATLALGQAWTKYPPDSTTPFPSTFDIDYIKVWRHNSSVSTKTLTPILSEAEELSVEAKSNIPHLTFMEDKLSGGAATILKAATVGEYVTYTVNVPEARTFNIRVGVKKGSTRGMFQMSVNGVNYGSIQDLYSPSSTYEELDLGNVTFDSLGHKSFKFTMTGKNSSSKESKLVFDYIKLIAK
jgi:beta-glucanase (GH16 family)